MAVIAGSNPAWPTIFFYIFASYLPTIQCLNTVIVPFVRYGKDALMAYRADDISVGYDHIGSTGTFLHNIPLFNNTPRLNIGAGTKLKGENHR